MYCSCNQKEKVIDVENMTFKMRAKSCKFYETKFEYETKNGKFIKN